MPLELGPRGSEVLKIERNLRKFESENVFEASGGRAMDPSRRSLPPPTAGCFCFFFVPLNEICRFAEPLQQHRIQAHPILNCPVDGCAAQFRQRLLLNKHLHATHGAILPGSKKIIDLPRSVLFSILFGPYLSSDRSDCRSSDCSDSSSRLSSEF